MKKYSIVYEWNEYMKDHVFYVYSDSGEKYDDNTVVDRETGPFIKFKDAKRSMKSLEKCDGWE